MKDFSKQKKVDKLASVDDRILFIKYCSDLYETNGSSPLNDFEWDTEKAELEQLDPNNSYFDEVGGLNKDAIFGQTCKHEIPMGSLNKSLTIEDFLTYLKSTHKDGTQFVFENKIDGLSLSLVYKGGKLFRASTRGDGNEGVIVDENVKYIKDIPQQIPCKDEVEVRGECYKGRKNFYAVWKAKGYANPRNFTSGSLMQKDPKITGERELSFIAYEVLRKEFDTEKDKFDFLVANGIPNNRSSSKWTKEGLTLDQVAKAAKAYMDSIDRANLEYDVDGIVCKCNSCKIVKSMGATNNRKPRANRAIKFLPEICQTEIEGVEFAVTRTGIISAVGLLKPVQIMGTMVSRVSLYNCGAIRDSKEIKIGSTVKIVKSGDIIPCIKSVVKVGNKNIDLPSKCPSCKGDLKWDETRVNLICDNTECTSQLASKIDHYLKCIGVKNIGMGLLSRLTDKSFLVWEGEPIISSLPEIYYMLDNDRKKSKHPFRKYEYLKEQLGEKTYSNILENVKSVKEITLAKLIEALGIGRIGSMAKSIAGVAPFISNIDKLTKEDLLKIGGFADVKASAFLAGWKSLRNEIEEILQYIEITEPKLSSNKLSGKSFCITGSLSKGRNEVQDMIEKNGGKVSSSVGKSLDYLICGEDSGSKEDKAKQLGVNIISEEEFLKLLK